MKRYEGEYLGEEPNITVLGSSKVGNFVATIPLLRTIRDRYPKARIDFWGSEITKDLETNLFYNSRGKSLGIIDWRISWDIVMEEKFMYLAEASRERGRPDWLINCDGYNPMTVVLGGLLNPKQVSGITHDVAGKKMLEAGDKPENKIMEDGGWDEIDFVHRYSGVLDSQYIAEIFCAMSFLKPDKKVIENIEIPKKDPDFDVPNLLIHCTSTRGAKYWPYENWLKILEWCLRNDQKVGIIGATPKRQKDEYKAGDIEERLITAIEKRDDLRRDLLVDLRGKTSLLTLGGACEKAKLVITVDSGPLHIAAATGTNVIAIVGNDESGNGASPIRLWMPRSKNVQRTISIETCTSCRDNKYKNDECIEDTHLCMNGVEVEQVLQLIEKNVIENKK